MAIRDFFGGNAPQTSVISPLSKQHQRRKALYSVYWDYYRGHHKKHLKIKPNTPDDNVILNYSKRVVNKSVQFLFGNPVTFEIDNQDGRTPAEDFLDAVWGGDETKMQLLQMIATNGSVCGDAFVRLHPAFNNGDLPRIVNIDPALVDVVTNADDVELVQSYRIAWKSGEDWKRHRLDLLDNGQWSITEEIARRNLTWEITNEELWPWNFPPLLHCQNQPLPNSFWGVSDLESADVNDAINFTASNINRILRFHAHPKTIGTGFDARQLQNTAVEEFWTITNEGARVFNLEMQSDLGSAYAFLSELRNAYSKVTGVPELDPSQVNVGALSGFALRILYGDLLELTKIKRNTYGAMLIEANRCLLEMAGYGADIETKINWESPLPESDTEEAATLTIDRQNGLSEETYLERRGYNVEREQQRLADEAAGQANIGEQLLAAFERGA
jgi:hypothetical protein